MTVGSHTVALVLVLKLQQTWKLVGDYCSIRARAQETIIQTLGGGLAGLHTKKHPEGGKASGQRTLYTLRPSGCLSDLKAGNGI